MVKVLLTCHDSMHAFISTLGRNVSLVTNAFHNYFINDDMFLTRHSFLYSEIGASI